MVHRPSFLERLYRNGLTNRLRGLRQGTIRLLDRFGVQSFGDTAAGESFDIIVNDLRFFRALALGGSLGGAEAYLSGWWSCDDLVGLLRLLTRNASLLAGIDNGVASLFRRIGAWGHFFRRNTLTGSRRNIAAHYDLGEDFYSLFLDETMTYSAGVFPRPNATLTEASREKYDRVCRQLRLSPRDRLLEIGSGWGGFALFAAQNYGCHVTATTISRRQFDFARARIDASGLNNRIDLHCLDYRQLQGRFDKLVSIEMIEAVGHEFLDAFFGQCSNLLRPEGAMLLQAITIPDQRYDAYRRSVDFIQKYIFPGGCLPSQGAMCRSIQRRTDLRMLHFEDFGQHYARTLALWRERFWQNIDAVRQLGFDERFVRMWHYYLCYCEAGFLENQIGVAQILLGKPQYRHDLPYTTI